MTPLLNDIARCDGLLPKTVTMPSGMKGVLWAIDCPKRETCARYLQMFRDSGDGGMIPYRSHYHKPGDKCPSYIEET
jgi:hypothetical protein